MEEKNSKVILIGLIIIIVIIAVVFVVMVMKKDKQSMSSETMPEVAQTELIDEGVTPFGIGCPECDGSAHSSMYPNCRPIPKHIPEPTFEFFKPKNNAEIKKYSKVELKEAEDKSKDIDINWLFKANKEHCNQGGLLMRKRTSAKIMLHDDEYTEEHE